VSGRYDRLATALLESPDPMRAIASVVGDHEARLDLCLERIKWLEARAAEREQS
jgi:hypothetical protein